jgi:hypothetical protein
MDLAMDIAEGESDLRILWYPCGDEQYYNSVIENGVKGRFLKMPTMRNSERL